MSETLDEANAAELQFGDDHRIEHGTETEREPNVQVLSNDEVYFLLELQRQKMLQPPHTAEELTETFKSLHAHLEKVVTTKNFHDLQNIASTLSPLLDGMDFQRKHDRKLVKLHPYEKTSLINLLKASDTTPEEVLHWIPSLVRFDEDQIQMAIDAIIEAKERVCEGL